MGKFNRKAGRCGNFWFSEIHSKTQKNVIKFYNFSEIHQDFKISRNKRIKATINKKKSIQKIPSKKSFQFFYQKSLYEAQEFWGTTWLLWLLTTLLAVVINWLPGFGWFWPDISDLTRLAMWDLVCFLNLRKIKRRLVKIPKESSSDKP